MFNPIHGTMFESFLCMSSLPSSGKCEGFCHNGGTCLQTSNGTKLCLCSTQYIGFQCELDKCQFCGTGKCLTSSSSEVSCRWVHSGTWTQNVQIFVDIYFVQYQVSNIRHQSMPPESLKHGGE